MPASVEEWYADLPQGILKRAYSSRSELAWARSDTVQIIQFLQERGYRVVGIDTWLPTHPGPTPLIDDWDRTRGMSALDFVRTFVWQPSDEVDRKSNVHFAIMAVRAAAAAETAAAS